MPLARSSALDHRFPACAGQGSASDVEELWSPALRRLAKNRRLKPLRMKQRSLTDAKAREDLSLSGGASKVQSVFFKLGITCRYCFDCSWNDEGDPLGSPSLRAAMRLGD
jgi:hypothetical protein